jgi:S-adenosylmethionine hydrolase
MRSIITLTTDFGLGTPYVAQMKGVILSLCRDVDLIDTTHSIGPQNIREAAVVLADTTPRFPPGTIHVVVVDPGVGTSRKLVYAEIGGQRYLAPDNGVLSLVLETRRASLLISLENAAYWLENPSNTFHGRDILAPVAAHLAMGANATDLGPPLESLITLPPARIVREGGRIIGGVLYVDTFGNLITNLRREDIESIGALETLHVACAGKRWDFVATYAAASPASPIALFDSQGRLEIAIVNGSAASATQAGPGQPVTISSVV